MTFIIERTISLFHKNINFTKPLYQGKSPKRFHSRRAAQEWIENHPFTGDKYDVIKRITYRVKPSEQYDSNAKPEPTPYLGIL